MLELSVQARSIWLEETAAAVKFEGGDESGVAVGKGVGVGVDVGVALGVGEAGADGDGVGDAVATAESRVSLPEAPPFSSSMTYRFPFATSSARSSGLLKLEATCVTESKE